MTKAKDCTYEQFSKVVGNKRTARKFWHIAVKFKPDKWRITAAEAVKETLTAAELTTVATVGNVRAGLTRKEYSEFVDAVNAYSASQHQQRR